MYSNFLHHHVELDCDPRTRARSDSEKNRKRRQRAFWHRSGFCSAISDLHNIVTKSDLNVLLSVATRASNVSDAYLDHVLGWDISTERCAVRFSERFSAIWVQYASSFVWFCVVDGEFIVFSLKRGSDNSQLRISQRDGAHPIPELSIPEHGLDWTVLQQLLVENFETDDEIRAISAAFMVSCAPFGKYSSVAKEMLPAELRMLNRSIVYDAPIDDDIVCVLADPRETNNRLVFQCGVGYWTESKMRSNAAVLRRIRQPKNTSVFSERAALLMPLFFH